MGALRDGDAIIFFNFRPDRARQITRAFTHSAPEGAAPAASRRALRVHDRVRRTIRTPVAFPPEVVENPLGEVVAAAGLRQLRIAETEKYAHVTYFFNGGREIAFEHEDRALIPSPKAATYDLQPAMSAAGITDELLSRLSATRHPTTLSCSILPTRTWSGIRACSPATIHALEVVDACIGRIVERVRALGGITLITADHGNAEQMIDADGGPLTAHTTNPVHLILVGNDHRALRDGIFADVAPTVLELFGLQAPAKMTGLVAEKSELRNQLTSDF